MAVMVNDDRQCGEQRFRCGKMLVMIVALTTGTAALAVGVMTAMKKSGG